jgi:hypothetical protein
VSERAHVYQALLKPPARKLTQLNGSLGYNAKRSTQPRLSSELPTTGVGFRTRSLDLQDQVQCGDFFDTSFKRWCICYCGFRTVQNVRYTLIVVISTYLNKWLLLSRFQGIPRYLV